MSEKFFKVKSGITTANIVFNNKTVNSNLQVSFLQSNVLSFSGTSGQLFSIADTMTGTIFAVNDISGIPSIEVYDTGDIRLAEISGNILIGSATNPSNVKLYVKGALGVTGNLSANVVTSGTWNGSTIAPAYGGTGKSTLPAAFAALSGFTTTATAAGTTALTNTSTAYQIFTGSTTQTVTLPDTSTLAPGWYFEIQNNSLGDLTIRTSTSASISISGGNLPFSTTCRFTCISVADNTAAAWDVDIIGFGGVSGIGSVVRTTNATITTPTITFSTATAVTAGSNAQGGGILSSDYNVVTTTAANPSGITLPSISLSGGRRVTVINKGTNPVVIYPGSGAAIDALATNSGGITLPVGKSLSFNAITNSQWYSSYYLMNAEADLVAGNVSTLTTSVNTIKANVDSVQSNVSTAITNINTVQSNVSSLTTSVNTIKTNVDSVSSNVTSILTGTTNFTGIKTFNTSTLVIDATNNEVGVGTDSPVAQFMVSGDGQTTSALTDSGARSGTLQLHSTTNTAGSGGALLFSANVTAVTNATPQWAIKSLLTDANSRGVGDLVFSGRASTGDNSLTERMRILSTGNVGIGTSSPAVKLDVVGSINANTINIGSTSIASTPAITLNSGTADSTQLIRDSSGLGILNHTGAASFQVKVVSAQPMQFFTSNTERFRVGSSGQFGIGGANYGTSGQTIISSGSAAAPAWGVLPATGGGTGQVTLQAATAAYNNSVIIVTSGATTTLTNTSVKTQIFSGVNTQTVVLPATSTLANGWTFNIYNRSTGIVTVNASGGGLVTTIPAVTAATFICVGTAGGGAASDWLSTLDGFYATSGNGFFVVTNNNAFISNMSISGTLTANGSVGTAGQVLTSNANGTYWSTPSSGGGITTGKAIAMAMIFGG